MDNSTIDNRDEVIKSNDKEIKTILTDFDEKKVTCKTQSFIFYLYLY